MSFEEVKNTPLLYILVIAVLIAVLGLAVLFAVKSWKRAKELGYTKEQLMRVIKSTVVATLVPSFAVVIGLFTLAAVLGNAWPWLRLSVMGALTYELMAADMAAASMGTNLSTIATAREFVNIMFVMTAGVISGTLVLIIFGEKIHMGAIKLGANKQSFGVVALECFMIGLLATYLPVVFVRGIVAILTFATSLLITVGLGLIVKKYNIKWLKDFILAFALIGGMASSLLWTMLF